MKRVARQCIHKLDNNQVLLPCRRMGRGGEKLVKAVNEVVAIVVVNPFQVLRLVMTILIIFLVEPRMCE